MNLSVIIPVYNHIDQTKNCLNLLVKLLNECRQLNSNIVVIDDGSTDGTGKWITENHPSIHLLFGNGNLFWSRAVTKGSIYALKNLNPDYLLIWNNDSFPSYNYFTNLLNLLNHNSINTIIGSKIYFMNNQDRIWSMGGIFNPYSGRKFMYGFNCMDGGQFNTTTTADWLPGMGTVIHKSVFQKIGFWDFINFPQYHGDSDFTLRAKENGFNILVSPTLKIWNDKSTTGLQHQKSLRLFFHSFRDIRSTKNFYRDCKFYVKHAKSIFAFRSLLKKYFLYIFRFVRQVRTFCL